MPRTAPAPTLGRAAEILTTAVVRAARTLGFTQKDLAALLGVSEASVSRLGRDRTIRPASKEGELAVLFVRLYRSLDSLLGGDDAKSRAWLRAPNHHLGGRPGELVLRVTGLVRVTQYLDAMRGKS